MWPMLIGSGFVWKALAVLALAGGLFVAGCQHGQADAEAKLAAVEASHESAARQARENARERERANNAVIQEANKHAEELIKGNADWYTDQLNRMRRVGASPARGNGSVPSVPITTAYCLGASGPTRDELLGHWKTLARLLREASDDRAALEACAAAWPR